MKVWFLYFLAFVYSNFVLVYLRVHMYVLFNLDTCVVIVDV